MALNTKQAILYIKQKARRNWIVGSYRWLKMGVSRRVEREGGGREEKEWGREMEGEREWGWERERMRDRENEREREWEWGDKGKERRGSDRERRKWPTQTLKVTGDGQM